MTACSKRESLSCCCKRVALTTGTVRCIRGSHTHGSVAGCMSCMRPPSPALGDVCEEHLTCAEPRYPRLAKAMARWRLCRGEHLSRHARVHPPFRLVIRSPDASLSQQKGTAASCLMSPVKAKAKIFSKPPIEAIHWDRQWPGPPWGPRSSVHDLPDHRHWRVLPAFMTSFEG